MTTHKQQSENAYKKGYEKAQKDLDLSKLMTIKEFKFSKLHKQSLKDTNDWDNCKVSKEYIKGFKHGINWAKIFFNIKSLDCDFDEEEFKDDVKEAVKSLKAGR